MLEPFLPTAGAVSADLDISSSKATADSLDRVVGDDPYFNKLIRILATRCMTQAVYFCSGDLMPPEFHHYGLASPLYTHFTSPIRRYAVIGVIFFRELLSLLTNRRKGRGLVRRRRALEGQEDGWKHQLQMVRIHMEVVEPQPTIEEDDITTAEFLLAEMIFNEVDPSLEVECFKKDGDSVSKWTQFAKVYGKVGASTKDAPQVESSVAKRGDILIDINDRFSRDFLSDIFSKKRLTEESSSISSLYSDGTGLSINIGHSFRS
ncbi:hypothetical protein IFM89_027472 [Coptis chinensis]|uniref:RNB domain-containing protein n=1 Tax=Coptis chinensis TaxID=261450 RepID=A0A835I088_9MAGN|nr:hypothetical protein IFM89_027472 [Coptis chinensis]